MVFRNTLKTYPSNLFIFSLILLLTSFIIYYYLKINIPLQYLITLNVFILFPIYLTLKRIKLVKYDIPILCSLIYFLLILPISTNFNIYETFKSYKDTIMPLIIYFYFRAYIVSKKKLNDFTYTIILAGGICLTYIFIELLLKATGNGINVWNTLEEYGALYHPYLNNILIHKGDLNVGSSGYTVMVPGVGNVINYLRPHGIFFDIHTQSFVMLSAIFIYFSYIINNQFSNKNYIFYILLVGIIFSTSATYIGLGLLLITYIYFILNKKGIKKLINKIYGKLIITLTCIIGGLLIIAPTMLQNFLIHKFIQQPGSEKTGVLYVLYKSVYDIATKGLFTIAESDFISFLIGKGTNFVGVIGSEAHYLGELISHLGLIGTLFYLLPYAFTLMSGYKILKIHKKKNSFKSPFFIFSICLPLVIFGTLIHYSPVNHCTVFIMAFCLFTGYLDWSYMRSYRYNISLLTTNGINRIS